MPSLDRHQVLTYITLATQLRQHEGSQYILPLEPNLGEYKARLAYHYLTQEESKKHQQQLRELRADAAARLLDLVGTSQHLSELPISRIASVLSMVNAVGLGIQPSRILAVERKSSPRFVLANLRRGPEDVESVHFASNSTASILSFEHPARSNLLPLILTYCIRGVTRAKSSDSRCLGVARPMREPPLCFARYQKYTCAPSSWRHLVASCMPR